MSVPSLDYFSLEWMLLEKSFQRGLIPWTLRRWLGTDEPYKDLEWENPHDYPILNRWKRAQEMKVQVKLAERDQLPSDENSGLIIHLTHLRSESTRLENEAALLFEMRRPS